VSLRFFKIFLNVLTIKYLMGLSFDKAFLKETSYSFGRIGCPNIGQQFKLG
jgi:hypothetical protein